MIVHIQKSNLIGEINAIPSKSYAHRILICSAFANKPTLIKNLPNSQDICATLNCIKALGAKTEIIGNDLLVYPTQIKENKVELNVGESGSTLRFMISIVSALGGEYILKGTKKLISRPNLDLLNCLKENGIDFYIGEDYIKIFGKLKKGDFVLNSSLSSQYLTGLMLSIPLLSFGAKIQCDNLSSSDYIEITKDVMQSFGVIVDLNNNCYTINGKYISPNEIIVEGDYSNSLFFAVGGVLNGNVSIKGLNLNSKQGDKKAFEILKKLGGNVNAQENLINFSKSKLNAINFNGDSIPDAIPCLSIALANAVGESVVSGVDRLKIKESDRLNAIIEILNISKIKSHYCNNKLYITGGVCQGGEYNGYNDHRMVMSLAILGSLIGNVTIIGAEAVNKSYPDFFDDFAKLGGKFWIE